MAKKELKKVFNLNSYEWWRNHRRVVTFGFFLSIFAFYLGNPFHKEAKVKDTCAKLNSSYQITGEEAMIYFIGTKHPDFTSYSYNQGSIIIDPWRYIPSIDNCEVIHIGDNLNESH